MRRRRQALNIRYTSNQQHRTRPWRSIIGTDLTGTTSNWVSDGVHLLSCLSAYVMNSRQVRCAKHEMCFALSMLLLVQNRHTLSLAKRNTVHGDTSLAVFLVVAALALLLHWLLVYRSSWFFCLLYLICRHFVAFIRRGRRKKTGTDGGTTSRPRGSRARHAPMPARPTDQNNYRE